MGHLYPNHVKAMHTNFVNAAIPSATSAPLHFATSMLKFLGHAPYIGALVPRALTYSDAEIEALKRAREWFEGDGRGKSFNTSTTTFGSNESSMLLHDLIWSAV